MDSSRSPVPACPLKFDGSDVLVLSAILTQGEILFASDTSYWTDGRKIAYLASAFEGPAAVWLGIVSPSDRVSYTGFRALVVTQFGLSDESAKRFALRRMASSPYRGKGGDDLLPWLGEFTSWMTSAGITDPATKSILILSNLPDVLRSLVLPQIADVTSLANLLKELREGVAGGTFSASTRASGGTSSSSRPRCGRCKKRGHSAKECRAPAPKT